MYMLGEEELARIALQKAVDASADFPGKDGARKRLSLLAINVGATDAGVRTALENYSARTAKRSRCPGATSRKFNSATGPWVRRSKPTRKC